MKPDYYTKAVLTVIAAALVMIACNQYVNPNTTAQAQATSFAGVQALSDRTFFDTHTGEYFTYGVGNLGRDGQEHDGAKREVLEKVRLTKLGQPMTVEYAQVDHIRKP
jgi:hypothetical protein